MTSSNIGAEHLRDAEQKIALCKIRAAVWEERLERLRVQNQPTEEAETQLSRLQKTQKLYERHREHLLDREAV